MYRDRPKDLKESALHKILLNKKLHRQQYILNSFKSRKFERNMTAHRCNNRTMNKL